MRAVVVTNPGPAEALRVIDVPTPVVGPGEVRIAVAAAAVNPVDIQTRAGVYHELGWVDQPEHTGLGWDVAGTVSAVGADVTASTPTLQMGMRVAALVPGVDRPLGAYADEVVVSPDAVAVVPDGLGLLKAATMPLNGLTALQALDILGDPAGRRLLVTGAAGAVGGYAVQLAAQRGWSVVALARETDRAFITRGGARQLVLTPEELGEGTVDAVFDPAALGDSAVQVLRDGGRYVGVIPYAVPKGQRGIHPEAVFVKPDAAALAQLLHQMAAGTLEARVHATVPLTGVGKAHHGVEAGGTRGRWVLVP